MTWPPGMFAFTLVNALALDRACNVALNNYSDEFAAHRQFGRLDLFEHRLKQVLRVLENRHKRTMKKFLRVYFEALVTR